MKIKLKGIYEDYKEDVLNAINEMISEYPILNQLIKIIHLKKMNEGFANCSATAKEIWGCHLRYEIKLNPEAFSKPDIYFLFAMVSGAYYNSVKSVIYHETGHCLQLFMPFEKLHLPLRKYNYFNSSKYYMISCNLIENEYKKYFAKFFVLFDWNDYDILTFIGSYAMDNPMELLPECFNLYYSLKDIPKRNTDDEIRYQFSKAVIEDYKKNYLQF